MESVMSETHCFVEVLLDQNLTKKLDYAVPRQWEALVEEGTRVEVPLKTQIVRGTVVGVKASCAYPNAKPILKILSDAAALTEPQWKLARWISHYYAAPLQKVLKCFIPPNIRQGTQPKTQRFIVLNLTRKDAAAACSALQNSNAEEALILETMLHHPKGMFVADLMKQRSVSKTAVQKLIKQNILSVKKEIVSSDLIQEEEFFQTTPKSLNAEQSACLEAIQAALYAPHFSAHLIHGVTGSGKTEVYLRAIGAALELGKGAILLVPEVSLTSQTIERFRSRFSEKIAILHHRRSFGERTAAWEALRKGDIRIAIGARSAIFAPMCNLGLIIVDEEHDGSYKQSEESPFYHARDVAVMRAAQEKATILLGSATPSLESRWNADHKKYRLHTLSLRASHASLPSVKIVDMKRAFEIQGGFTHFSPELLEAMQKRLSVGEQTLLLLNRRGYHRLQICPDCRTTIKCPHCDLGLTFHREVNLLQCHLCGLQKPVSRNCAACGSPNELIFKGFGTEHAERALHAVFPDIRTLRMDRDTTTQKESHETIFKSFRAHKADILIGTQMIAKGFHFPSVTLVGVLNADAPLSIPDFRAAESTFQLLTQVAGRSGRSELPGEVILQTFLPHHPVLKLAAAHDYNAFYQAELKERSLFGFPPFSRFVKCLFLSKEAQQAERDAHAAYAFLQQNIAQHAQILPVTASGHPKIKDLYRFQFLMRSQRIEPLLPWLERLPPCKSQCKIDVDPLSTFF